MYIFLIGSKAHKEISRNLFHPSDARTSFSFGMEPPCWQEEKSAAIYLCEPSHFSPACMLIRTNTQKHFCLLGTSRGHWFIMAMAQMFQWCVAAVGCVCVNVCVWMYVCVFARTPLGVSLHTCIHACIWAVVCVSECNLGSGRACWGGVWSFFKHSCVVMVAWALMLPKPPTKRLSFSAPDSGEGNDFQIGGPTHRWSQTAGVRWAGFGWVVVVGGVTSGRACHRGGT